MATQKKTTRKLTGIAKERFFDNVSVEEAKRIVTSLRVRNDAYPVSRALQKRGVGRSKPTTDTAPAPKSVAAETRPATPPPKPAPTPPSPAPAAPEAVEGEGFDAFQFGLVPIFKREGAEGLRAKLDGIPSVDNLREMAKAQQIILPREIRRGEVDVQTVRTAILDAVEQRVTDRKAQL
ncbi:MAG: hypothetical protein RIC14_13090 [Filomicrobium sp.]